MEENVLRGLIHVVKSSGGNKPLLTLAHAAEMLLDERKEVWLPLLEAAEMLIDDPKMPLSRVEMREAITAARARVKT